MRIEHAVLAGAMWSMSAAAAAQAPPEPEAPAEASDGGIYANGALDQFVLGFGRDEEFRWEGEAWAGTFKNRLWLRSEGRIDRDGDVRDGRLGVGYRRRFGETADFARAGLANAQKTLAL